MLLSLEVPTLPHRTVEVLFRICLFLLLGVSPGFSQKARPEDTSLPKYDLHTETKTKGVIDEVNVLSVGTRKDFTELIIKNGDDKLHIYVCPSRFKRRWGSVSPRGIKLL